MRIISGKHKGRRINAPKNLPVRPTTDMAKEGLFNILNNTYFFEDLIVLDLFAGAGTISYEFASRGARQITAIDSHNGCVRFIASTADQLEIPISVLKENVFSYLKKAFEKFDIIFADPPYSMEIEYFEQIVQVVFEKALLYEHGTLIIEHAKQMDLSHLSQFERMRKYGGSVFSFFTL